MLLYAVKFKGTITKGRNVLIYILSCSISKGGEGSIGTMEPTQSIYDS